MELYRQCFQKNERFNFRNQGLFFSMFLRNMCLLIYVSQFMTHKRQNFSPKYLLGSRGYFLLVQLLLYLKKNLVLEKNPSPNNQPLSEQIINLKKKSVRTRVIIN